MEIYNNISEFKDKPKVVLTIGSFDGMHLAHKAIIQELKCIAKEYNAYSLVITFDPHPQLVLRANSNFKILTQLNEKVDILQSIDIDYLLVLKFSRYLAGLKPENFISYLSSCLDIKAIVMGYNHSFGKNKTGDFKFLNAIGPKYNFKLYQVPKISINNTKISSSVIREKLLETDIKGANALLGYCYSFQGTVIYGDQLGRKIGFPTANLVLEDKHKLVLPDSCYVVKVIIDKVLFGGMMYIGNRPTVNGRTHNVEVNIFNFDADIYGKCIKVLVLDYLRADYKFNSLDALVQQLNIDRENSIKILEGFDV